MSSTKNLFELAQLAEASYAARVGRISLRNPPNEKMSQILKPSKIPPTDNASLIRPTKYA